MVDLGYDLVTPGNDVGMVRAAAAERIAVVRGTDDRRRPATGGGY